MKIIWEETDLGAGQRVQPKTRDDDVYMITYSVDEDDWNLVNLTTGKYVVYLGSAPALLQHLNDNGYWPVEFLKEVP